MCVHPCRMHMPPCFPGFAKTRNSHQRNQALSERLLDKRGADGLLYRNVLLEFLFRLSVLPQDRTGEFKIKLKWHTVGTANKMGR